MENKLNDIDSKIKELADLFYVMHTALINDDTNESSYFCALSEIIFDKLTTLSSDYDEMSDLYYKIKQTAK